MKAILEIKNLNKKLNGKDILKNVNFSVGQGEIYGFLGPNGAGKTTTMKNILRFMNPDSGEIKIFSKNVLDEEVKKQIGFMPENTYLYKHLTGKEFLKFNGKFFGLFGQKLDQKVQNLLKKLGLENAGDKFLKDYSKGMLQRIGLAQAIINEPKLLFLDEPMSGLDPIGRKMVKDLIVELNSSGTTIFFNTHILADVESICDKISIIHNGEIIVESKKVSEIKGSLEDYFIEQVTKN
ncbi:ABC transporter ATP-binding protein [Candidatus Gracilibacteria bacterium]|nr:MAG: ABC transporter ATP-binding protein [Candidatus Gracilibacteria bacterium]